MSCALGHTIQPSISSDAAFIASEFPDNRLRVGEAAEIPYFLFAM